jgi:hypothetical protein
LCLLTITQTARKSQQKSWEGGRGGGGVAEGKRVLAKAGMESRLVLHVLSTFLDQLYKYGMMRIIAERTLELDEELYVYFIDWQKAFDRVNWTKLMQILKASGIDWRERRLISKLYMDQKVKVRLDRGETRSVQIGRGVRQG